MFPPAPRLLPLLSTVLVALSLVPGTARAAVASVDAAAKQPATWTSDNGNGTFTNPLFYDEFSDPDVIRVGDDYYLTGTTMHTMPGLPILHSKDLVNWKLLTYAIKELDLGPEYRLQGGEIYGQGIWAPCLRYHNGTFYLFTNVNGRKTQLLRATNPAGPWTRTELGSSLHDLSVLFDDNGKIYVVWSYNQIMFAELKPDLSDIIPETKRVLIPAGSGMGEGAHFYKIDGRYYIFSANYDPICYEVVARADRPEGPYSVVTTSAGESFGAGTGWRLKGMGRAKEITLIQPRPNDTGGLPMHQGGIVQTQTGEWWGISMMDHNSVGRLACLSPVSWRDGWPYFGLPGNPTRTPLTWLKPNTGHASPPSAPYQRSDDFSGPELLPVWQWNHAPDNSRWSLAERPGMLRLHAAGAPDFWRARNSLTQRTVGPESSATTVLETAGMQPGDLAGLAILNLPYGWIGVRRDANGTSLVWFDQTGGNTKSLPVTAGRIWLRTHCDFEKEQASFSYSLDGLTYQEFGDKLTLVFQLKTFQGARFALFNYNELGKDGGHADFDAFEVAEPRANGQRNPIPLGRTVTLSSLRDGSVLTAWNGLLRAAPATVGDPTLRHFRVLDRGRGRIALQSVANGAYVSVTGQGMTGDLRLVAADPGEAADFQWQQMESGDFMLLSVTTHRHLCIEPQANGLLSAQAPGATPDRRNGASFRWTED